MEYGHSYGHFLSYGIVDDPEDPSRSLIRSGTYSADGWAELDLNLIAEDLSHSWFKQTPVVQPPSEGKTEPDPSVEEGYSWSKAPRYGGQPMQTGPIAQALVDGDSLFMDLFAQQGDSVFVRELARLLRPVKHLMHLKQQVGEVLTHFDELSYIPPRQNFSGEGVGITEAARGALGHWVRIENGQIEHYQIITPTAWNASPKDQAGQPGAWEKALIGQPLKDPDHPMEMGHIIRSFDPCLVCTVHAMGDLDAPQTHYFGV